MERVLELKNVHYSYHTLEGETPAISDISFSLGKGQFIAIVGPSGCGKSTLLSLIAGLLTPASGTIKINGKNQEESTTNVGYMLQHDELFEWRNIYHNAVHYILTGNFENHIFFVLRYPVKLPWLHTFGNISYTNDNDCKQAYRSNKTPDCRTCPNSNDGVIIC